MRVVIEETKTYTVDDFDVDAFLSEFAAEFGEFSETHAAEGRDALVAAFVTESVHEMTVDDFLWARGVNSYKTDNDVNVEVR